MKEYKVGDVVTYMIRPSDWMRGPIVRGVRRRSSEAATTYSLILI